MSEGAHTASLAGREPSSLYIHVPFCVSKCAYCSFHSAPVAAAPAAREYFVRAVGESVAQWAATGVLGEAVSVYVGGGTPTVLGASLANLIGSVRDTLALAESVEITVETNPDTTDYAHLNGLLAAGVNRFSLGVQSFDDEVLRTLRRTHTAARAKQAARELVATGARVSLDLMCGVPGQTAASWEQTLVCALESGAGHLSVYPLSLEEPAPLARAVASGALEAPDEDLAAEMMLRANSVLAAGGLARYEVASYARTGEESVHNTGYWTGRPYVGIGPSAASMLPASLFVRAMAHQGWASLGVAGVGRNIESIPPESARVRFTRKADTDAFLRDPAGPPEETEYLTELEAKAEDAMLGMRLTRGISNDLAAVAGALGALQTLRESGLVTHVDGRWSLTEKGWLLGNEVFEAILFAHERRPLA